MSLSPLKYGTVKGRFIAAVADTTNDADDEPDAIPLTGKVTFRPDVQAILVGNGSEAPVTVMPAPITAQLDSQGYLTLNGQRGVKLIATDNIEANPTNFTYTVELDLKYSGTAVKYPGWSIEVPADRETDLTLQGRVPSASGTAIIRGASVTDITAANGVITFALSDSTSHQVSIEGTLVSSIDGQSGAVDLTEKYAPYNRWRKEVGTQDGIRSALLEAKSNISPVIPGATLDPSGTRVIHLPPGDITITEAFGLLGVEDMTQKITGLRFVGAGKYHTRIVFDPADGVEPVLAKNDFWLGLWFEGMTFATKRAGAVFMQSHTTHSAQTYSFTDVAWAGPWKYGFDLRGNDNNSEYIFIGCETVLMDDSGAFLHIGDVDTSDQFLNYWFYGFKHWSTSASLIDAARGGHFHLSNVDASDWGKALTTKKHLINLRGFSHGQGVTTMTATGLRVEAKNALAGMLYSEWPSGNVSIQADWSSQTPFFQFGDIINVNLGNTPGAVYDFHDSNLAGGIRVAYGTEAWRYQHRITVRDTHWQQRLTPSEVVSYDRSQAGVNVIDPTVKFDNCRGDAQNALDANGSSVWDADISHARGGLVKSGHKRSVVVHAIYGNVHDADGTLTINLPLNAIITGLRVVSPITIDANEEGGSWLLRTTEATPTVIAEGTHGPGASGEHDVVTEPNRPFLCDTRSRATVTVSSQGVTTTRPGAFCVIEGYW